jgi:hypothetical protein
MNKPAFRSTTSKAAFQWDPNSDQVYSDNGPPQRLSGAAENFSKAPGKTFIMDAPGGELTLEVDSGALTTWAGELSPVTATIDVKNGLFTYNANKNTDAVLQFGSNTGTPTTNLTVENTGHCTITGFSSKPAKGGLKGYGTVLINAKNSGFLEIDCGTIEFKLGAKPRITIEDKARMSAVCDHYLWLADAFVTVSSAPDTGYSLDWASRSTSSDDSIELTRSVVNFIGKASGLFRCPNLQLLGSSITASGNATCFFQFDGTGQDPAQFNLGPGSAMMRFDGYSEGALPFVYSDLVPGVFNFATRGITSESLFRFRVPSPDAVNAILSSGTISIDNVPQYNNSRLNVDYGADGYVDFSVQKK